MAEDIQGFLNRIKSEGIEKADAEKAEILASAKAEAAKIVEEAKAEAAKIVADARSEAKLTEEKGTAAVRQAARDVLIGLKQNMLDRMQNLVKASAGDAMTPQVMADLVLAAAKAWREKNPDGDCTVDVLVSKKDAEALQAKLNASLLASLKADPVIRIGSGMDSGLQIGFSGTDVYLDFSDEALAELVSSFAGPRIAAILKG